MLMTWPEAIIVTIFVIVVVIGIAVGAVADVPREK